MNEIDKLRITIEALYELQRPQHAGLYLSCNNPDCDSRIKIYFVQRNSTINEITDLYCPNCGTLNNVV